MKKTQKLLLGLVAACMLSTLSSCLDITESYYFRKDGSGTASFEIDMSKMAAAMESFKDFMPDSTAAEDSEEKEEDPPLVTEENPTADILKTMPGISNVKNLNDPENYIMAYSFEFKDLAALNHAMAYVESDIQMEEGQADVDADDHFKHFSFKGKTIVRNHKEMDKDEEEDNLMGGMAEAWEGAFYTVNYKFERKVKKASHQNAEVDKKERTVQMKIGMGDIVLGKTNLATEIKLK